MNRVSFIEGIIVGAVVGAVTGIIATSLLAPASGKETRDNIKDYLDEIKETVTTRLEAAGDSTKNKYGEIVKAVIGEYEVAKKITVDEAAEIEARLHGCFEAITGKA